MSSCISFWLYDVTINFLTVFCSCLVLTCFILEIKVLREEVMSSGRRILLDIIRNPSRRKNVYRTFVLTSTFFLKCNNFLFSYIILYSSYISMLYMLKHCFAVSFQVLCLLTQFKLCFVKCTHLKCSVFNSLKHVAHSNLGAFS